ncbi:helix-turn-helix domain-containing protein [Nitratireductor basaltis]|uniref:MerR family transcriptional regulator n=1 Tax=Nitratireductor basaltis TaxID=472175 RepID=A0A084UCD7_9HYPH|nr:helix-turn-helix domain-containing protein [Nitratireductor basaltis]KFB10623.1 MerR family transcriptional regulator [Nitratireductor basaltis]
MKFLDIGEVVARSGLSASTLRYYEEIGAIRSVARHGLRRQYEPQVLTQLSLISAGKAAGFSLEEIGAMFGPQGEPQLSREAMRNRAEELEAQIRRLSALAKTVRHAAECQAKNQLQCPKFQRLLRLATRREQHIRQSRKSARAR